MTSAARKPSHPREVVLIPYLAILTGIVHRDLKLENMILQNERDDSPVKIADFGKSQWVAAGVLVERH
eukprot:1148393-Pelagomonas_calceolata.AAC.3